MPEFYRQLITNGNRLIKCSKGLLSGSFGFKITLHVVTCKNADKNPSYIIDACFLMLCPNGPVCMMHRKYCSQGTFTFRV